MPKSKYKLTSGGPNINCRPSEWSPADCERVVAWYATLPLRELRQRQSLTMQQRVATISNPTLAERANTDLKVISRLLFHAVFRKEFSNNYYAENWDSVVHCEPSWV